MDGGFRSRPALRQGILAADFRDGGGRLGLNIRPIPPTNPGGKGGLKFLSATPRAQLQLQGMCALIAPTATPHAVSARSSQPESSAGLNEPLSKSSRTGFTGICA